MTASRTLFTVDTHSRGTFFVYSFFIQIADITVFYMLWVLHQDLCDIARCIPFSLFCYFYDTQRQFFFHFHFLCIWFQWQGSGSFGILHGNRFGCGVIQVKNRSARNQDVDVSHFAQISVLHCIAFQLTALDWSNSSQFTAFSIVDIFLKTSTAFSQSFSFHSCFRRQTQKKKGRFHSRPLIKYISIGWADKRKCQPMVVLSNSSIQRQIYSQTLRSV